MVGFSRARQRFDGFNQCIMRSLGFEQSDRKCEMASRPLQGWQFTRLFASVSQNADGLGLLTSMEHRDSLNPLHEASASLDRFSQRFDPFTGQPNMSRRKSQEGTLWYRGFMIRWIEFRRRLEGASIRDCDF